jgi:hypothetical protein
LKKIDHKSLENLQEKVFGYLIPELKIKNILEFLKEDEVG